MSKNTIIKNIGTIVSGDINDPLLEGNAILIKDDTISFVGDIKDINEEDISVEIDAKGLTASPGLIDAHAHPPMANYLANFKAYDWVDNYAATGITGIVSVGGIRFPGAAVTARGAKNQALGSKHLWDAYHPCGVKVHAGAVMLEPDFCEEDFAQMAEEGLGVIGEIGMSGAKEPCEVAQLVKMAKKHGFISTIHCGGPSSQECATYSVDEIMAIEPEVLCHINGAPTPMDPGEIKEVIKNGDFYYDVISNGNLKAIFTVIDQLTVEKKLDRLMLGTNVPSMTGFSPMGLWVLMAAIASFSDVEPAMAVAMGTGNIAKCYGLDHGIIKKGYKADIIFTDTGSPMKDMLGTLKYGRVPSVASTVVNGQFTLAKCKNTAPPKVRPVVKRFQ